jgi:Ser/Thr protein kinase RdoA (MazF antagonist)
VATEHHLEVLFNTDYLLADFQKSFQHAAEQFIKKADPFFNHQEFILLHGDCHKGNLIHRPGEGIFIVDFDDICFGPPVQDLWMLLPGSVEDCENELNWFFKGYEVFRSFDRRSLSLIPLLRGMRIIHFVSWLAVQSKEPGFTKHFPKAGTKRYWNELIKELQEITFQIY